MPLLPRIEVLPELLVLLYLVEVALKFLQREPLEDVEVLAWEHLDGDGVDELGREDLIDDGLLLGKVPLVLHVLGRPPITELLVDLLLPEGLARVLETHINRDCVGQLNVQKVGDHLGSFPLRVDVDEPLVEVDLKVLSCILVDERRPQHTEPFPSCLAEVWPLCSEAVDLVDGLQDPLRHRVHVHLSVSPDGDPEVLVLWPAHGVDLLVQLLLAPLFGSGHCSGSSLVQLRHLLHLTLALSTLIGNRLFHSCHLGHFLLRLRLFRHLCDDLRHYWRLLGHR
mmetsp:Transcript_52756/g.132617  ORF Transcript_52756/g.132617 Transcript_52756/m.132617 type:complete len:282 (+) Transcript_52756:352-1197(+)